MHSEAFRCAPIDAKSLDLPLMHVHVLSLCVSIDRYKIFQIFLLLFCFVS